MQSIKKNILRSTIIIVVALVIIAGALWRFKGQSSSPASCFDFSHNMQFGDRKVDKPVNQGTLGPDGHIYYLPEVPALQMALKEQGFYVDPYEMTGGKVYLGAFWGPSTRAAVLGFQKKYGLEQTGVVDDATIDKLHGFYACPHAAATSTAPVATTTAK